MKNFALIAVLLFLLTIHLNAAEKTIDTSSNKRLQETYFDIITSLNEHQQQKFASSMASIGVVLSQEYGEEESHKRYIKLVNGKTAEEIIAIADSMLPKIKGISGRINGKSVDKFNASVGQILITLPLDKQRAFSAAIAKIMYDAEKKKKSKEDMAKSIDGLTATDVIAFAKTIDAPFLDADNSEIKLAPLSDSELKEYNLEKKSEKEEKTPFTKSLVPR